MPPEDSTANSDTILHFERVAVLAERVSPNSLERTLSQFTMTESG
jgi:hypothetical protein